MMLITLSTSFSKNNTQIISPRSYCVKGFFMGMFTHAASRRLPADIYFTPVNRPHSFRPSEQIPPSESDATQGCAYIYFGLTKGYNGCGAIIILRIDRYCQYRRFCGRAAGIL